ncbi:MAG: hypothetical protein F4137_14060 [Acidobacteria bacterium]|nr:hypothetical protein [Acidobacteriota bacterium]
MPLHDRPAPRKRLPLKRTFRPDTVLLRRELRWTAATALTLGVFGHTVAGAHGAAIGAGSGFLLQQAAYRLIVRTLWYGWQTRCFTFEGDVRAAKMAYISLRAFTLWMRRAGALERLYIALWNVGGDHDDESEVEDSRAEIRIRNAYTQAFSLNNVPLRCDNARRRRLRTSLQRDEARLLRLATGQRLER